DQLAGGSGGSAVTGPPLDGSAGHGGGVTNERSLRQGAIIRPSADWDPLWRPLSGYFRCTVSRLATGSALCKIVSMTSTIEIASRRLALSSRSPLSWDY